MMCSIVPLSTSAPSPVLPHHLEIELDPPLPKPYDRPRMWVKADIVLTVAFHRLRFLFVTSASGERVYDKRILDHQLMDQVRACVRAGLGL